MIQDEAKIFQDRLKHEARDSDATRRNVFQQLSSGAKWQTESYKIFEFIDEITNKPRDNWIQFYSTMRDVFQHLRNRLDTISTSAITSASPAYEALIDQIRFPKDRKPPAFSPSREPIPGLHNVILGARYVDEAVLRSPIHLQRLCDAWSKNIYEIVLRGYKNVELVSFAKHNMIFFSLDTQTDLNNTDVWRRDTAFLHYLNYTGKEANKAGTRVAFVRFIVMFEPPRLKSDSDYRRSIVRLINQHLSLGIEIGFVRVDLIPKAIDLDFIDLNSIVGLNVNVFSVPTGLAQTYDLSTSNARVKEYEDLYLHLHDSCRAEERACYVTQQANSKIVHRLLAPLFAWGQG